MVRVEVDLTEKEINKLVAAKLVEIAATADKKVEDVLTDFDQALSKVRTAW